MPGLSGESGLEVRRNPITANHKCQRCGLYPIKWSAVSDLMDMRVCVFCAVVALDISKRTDRPGYITVTPLKRAYDRPA